MLGWKCGGVGTRTGADKLVGGGLVPADAAGRIM
jgi:hypothetical protein